MSSDLPDNLRKYIKSQDKELSERANNFWRIVKPILERQNSPGSNENGYNHVKMVEHNAWRLIKDSNNTSEFNPYELFILSCSACSHDFDKGLFEELPDNVEHGKGSGDFLIENYEKLQQNFPEVVAIKKIIGIHDLPKGKFQEELKYIEKIFPLSTGPVQLKKLAVILKTADILHTDNSRIPFIGIDISKLNGDDKNKYLARESITGWHVDGSQIIIKAVPKNVESYMALNDCIQYIEKIEWPSVEEKLSAYNFPFKLSFHVDDSMCGKPKGYSYTATNQDNIIIEKDGSDIPPIVTNWIGREKELAILKNNFKVFFITGIGGQGKSALAAQYIKDINLKNNYKYIDWRDFKEEGHKFQNKIISMITLVTQDNHIIDDLIGLNDDDLISIFFKQLADTKAIFILDNVDSYIDLETFEPIKGIGKLFNAVITKEHKSKFIFTCRPFIRYAGVDFYQLALSGLSEENTIQFFEKSNIPVKTEDIPPLAIKAHKLTKGHPLWISLIIAQAKRGKNEINNFFDRLESSSIVENDISSILSETILREIWLSLNQKQQKLLRVLTESVRAENIDDLSEISSSELNYNAFSKSLRTLKNFNLIVEKLEGDFIELHPLVKEFVRTKYPSDDRSKYISLFISYYDRIVLILKPKLSYKLSFSEFANWTNKIELHTNAKEFQKAFDCLAEIKKPMLAAGYIEELLRVSKILFNSLNWTRKQIDSLNQFSSVLQDVVKAAIEFDDLDFANYLIKKIESIIEYKENDYIQLCSLKGYFHWFTQDYKKATKIYEEAEYLLTSGSQPDKYNVKHNLALSLRDSRKPENIKQALKIFLQNEELDSVSDLKTIDENLGGPFYGNIGRCLQFNSEFEKALNCLYKSFILIFIGEDKNRLLNIGYASEWISEVLLETNDIEPSLYFLKYATELWKNYSPPLANRCKRKLLNEKSTSTINSILSLEFWQIEKYCKNWIKKNSDVNNVGF